jgi:hypothetical protein
MSNDEALKTARRWFEEMWSKPEPDLADQLVAPDYDPDSVQIPAKGPDQVKHEIRYFRSIFPDLRYTIIDMAASGMRVWVRYQATGTQQGSAWGFEPTGKTMTMEGITILEMNAAAQVVDRWGAFSFYDVLVDLSLAPPLWELKDHLNWPGSSAPNEPTP